MEKIFFASNVAFSATFLGYKKIILVLLHWYSFRGSC